MVGLYLVMQLLSMEQTQGKGQGDVQFLRYTDDYDCEWHSGCDFYFKPLEVRDENDNVLLDIAKTNETVDKKDVNLTQVSQLRNPLTIDVPTNKSVKIYIEVYDGDGAGNNDDHVRTIQDQEIPFSTQNSGITWTYKSYTVTGATLKIKYRLLKCDDNFTGLGCNYCKPDYYTELCDKYCVPVTGNYTCNSTTGDKICVDNKVGPNCDQCKGNFTGAYCDKCAPNFYPNGTCDVFCELVVGKYNCTDQGARRCVGNWTGTDCESCVSHHYGTNCDKFCNETANYRCDNSGDKDCKDYFHPPHQCDKYCKPVAGKYNCTDQGEKFCARNWNGTDCDSCSTHYFGTNCSTFCIKTHNYTCNGSGDKLCKTDFYPKQKCDVYCRPKQDFYTCNQTTGDKICGNRTTGAECDKCVVNYYPEGACNVYCVPVAQKFDCNKQGGRDCLGNWNGTDCDSCVNHYYGSNCSNHCNETDKYTCDNSGDKVCKDHFYPQHQCDKYCKPVAGKYNCSDQGDKVCFKNRNGTDCDSCSTHYFGTNCSTFCNETTNYTCNRSGNRQCREHYYPEKQCDTYCKPIRGTYRCNQTTGEKICEGKRSGEDCEQCVQNYYPKGQCDVFCAEEENYSCTDHGEKKCIANRRGPNCTLCVVNYYGKTCEKFCKENQYYTCTEEGEKKCLKSTASPDKNCGADDGDKEEVRDRAENTALIGGAGGGAALILILLIVAMLVALSRRRKKRKHEEKHPESGVQLELVENPCALYSTIDKAPVYSTLTKQPPILTTDEEDVYNRLERPQTKPSRASHSNEAKEKKYADVAAETGEEQGDVYAKLDKTRQHRKAKVETDQEDTYAKLDRTGKLDVTETQMKDYDEEDRYADHVIPVTTNSEPDSVYAKLDKTRKTNKTEAQRKKRDYNEEEQYADHFPSTEEQDVYSRLDRSTKPTATENQDCEAEPMQEDETYADITITAQSQTEDDRNVQAQLDMEMTQSSASPAEEGETYADVQFVKSSTRDSAVVYSSPSTGIDKGNCGDPTYITVTEQR